MEKWKKIVITVTAIIVFIAIFAVITGISSDLGHGTGIFGLIALSALIFALKYIWKNNDDEEHSSVSSTQAGKTICSSQNKQPNSKMDIRSDSWDKVELSIFSSHKNELLECCSPARFMEPYDHDKVELANKITIKINAATNFGELKNVAAEIMALGVRPSSRQLYKYLCDLCNPTKFIGKDVEFKASNDIYGQVLNAKDDIMELYSLLEKEKAIYLTLMKSPESSLQQEKTGKKQYSDLALEVGIGILACLGAVLTYIVYTVSN